MTHLPYALTEDRPPQLGMVVLQSDETLEADLGRLLPQRAELLVTRIPSSDTVSCDSLGEMARDLTAAASLLPRGAKLAVVGFGCTSGTAQIGAGRIAQLTRAGVETQAVTDPVSALIAACRQLGLSRLALVSPYVEEVSTRLMDVLAEAGIEIAAFASFNEANEARVVRIAPGAIVDAARATVAQAPCDAVFLSCTNLRTLDVIAPIEAELGLPVLSSNLVLAWHMAHLAGLKAAGIDAALLRA
ncbi:Asp/Glu racemase [Rhodobacteraceae bacterium N5(2021)]|uniref:Asp/Glu racemase n=1 Tax=Gymnodinialimonas phycosphaerae TaxID=2841589 RepID=A0A975TVY4_9RHOB|nr:Asp/Glu racemase [Gymnodinialimonas phycosphaerae]MBY4891623.1 Asp/Glu racemase [Gymnodinialimonas phycosphaerae]